MQDKREEKGLERKEIAPVEVKVSTNTVTTKRWTFEVVDESKIPRKYLTVNTVAINQAVRNGVREIDGLNIFQTEGLRV